MKKEIKNKDFDPILEEKLKAFQNVSPFEISPKIQKAKKDLQKYVNKKLGKKKSS